MKRPCLVRSSLAAVAMLAAPLVLSVNVLAEDAVETFAIEPLQSVSFGGPESDSFSVEEISRHTNSVTVLLRPMGEGCVFRFPISVGRSVQLRTDMPSGQTMMCKATLQPIGEDGIARFGAECNEEPISHEHKCPADGDTASVDRPQH
jgi:hypothetical protein